MRAYLSCGIVAALIVLIVSALHPVHASHAWTIHHWQRSSSKMLEIPTRRMLSSVWLARFTTAMADWRKPAMKYIRPKHTKSTGQNASCPVYPLEISVCNGNYGGIGWSGEAAVLAYGGHTYYARARQNDYYFPGSSSAIVADRQLVICQEIGHLLGLGHVNVTFNTPNVGSCMDYTNDADGGPGGVSQTDPNNMHPYAHDYAVINARHQHIGFVMPGQQQEPEIRPLDASLVAERMADIGRVVYRANAGYTVRHERDFGDGWTLHTWVIKPIR